MSRTLLNAKRAYLSVTAMKPKDRSIVAAIKSEAQERGVSVQALVLEICRGWLDCFSHGGGHG